MRQKNLTNLTLIMKFVIMGLFLLFQTSPSWAFDWDDNPRLRTPGINPYSYIPLDRVRPRSRADYAGPREIPSVAPKVPLVVKDSDGNTMYYSPKGKLLVKLDVFGNVTHYSQGGPILEKDDTGSVTRRYERLGRGREAIKNEHGEIVGFQQYGRGGKLLKVYDEMGREIKSYEYNGRRLNLVIDLLTNSKTIYNGRGKPDRDVNFQGAIMARYYYADDGKLLYKVDLYGNKTLYDRGGRQQITYDVDNNVIATYEWTSRNSYKITDQHGNTTVVEYDRPRYEMNYVGYITKTYNWDGTKLISSTDILKNGVTYYENGRPVETRDNGYLVALWKYDDQTGLLISVTDRDGLTIYFDHGREGFGITDDDFDLENFTQDYKPPMFDEVTQITRRYKDTSESIMSEVEKLLEEKGSLEGDGGSEGDGASEGGSD